MENLYEILEVSKNASKEVIEKAYKVLVKRYHPDVAQDKHLADKKMKSINNAYAILSDDDKRKEYDNMLMQYEQARKDVTNNYIPNHNIKRGYDPQLVYEHEKKVINIDNRALFALIAVSLILLVFACANLVTNISQFVNGNNVEQKQDIQYVYDDTCIPVVERMVQGFKEVNIEKINNELVNKDFLNHEEFNMLANCIDMYNVMLANLSVIVKDIRVYKDSGQVDVSIKRNNVHDIVMDYQLNRVFTLDSLSDEQKRALLMNSIEKYTEYINIDDTYMVQNINNVWKIELTNSNINKLLGISINDYIE